MELDWLRLVILAELPLHSSQVKICDFGLAYMEELQCSIAAGGYKRARDG